MLASRVASATLWQLCTSIHSSLKFFSPLQSVAAEIRSFSTSTGELQGDAKPPLSQKVRFVDARHIEVCGGSGGGGSSALFGRSGEHPRAAGGQGGKGGGVVLRASKRALGLGALPRVLQGEQGRHGGKQWCVGANGSDRVVLVPVGTVVRVLAHLDDEEAEQQRRLLEDRDYVEGLEEGEQEQDDQEEDGFVHPRRPTLLSAAPAAPGSSHRSSSGGSNSSAKGADVLLHSARQPRPRLFDWSVSSDEQPSSSSSNTSAINNSSSNSTIVSSATGSSSTSSNAEHAGSHAANRSTSYFEALLAGHIQLTDAEKRRLWLGLQSPQEEDLQYGGPGPGSEASEGQSGYSAALHSAHTALHSDAGRPAPQPWPAAALPVAHQLTKQQVLAVLAAQSQLLGELTREGQEVRVCEGGVGGFGNAHFRSKPWGPASRRRLPGRPGQRRLLLLEAKMIADVALVGLPNAGKSTLLSALSAARAQVGDYAFTTLRPQLGTVQYDDGASLTVADIPGLIEGAHANRGKGNAFLRHIERSHCLAFVIDLSGASSPSALVQLPPEEQLRVLVQELSLYRAPLLQAATPLVVANKVDAVQEPDKALAKLKASTQWPVVPVSAGQKAGLQRLRAALRMVVIPACATAASAVAT